MILTFNIFNREDRLYFFIFSSSKNIECKGDKTMAVVHFLENNSVVLTQLLQNIPSINQDVKIKGRKGKVVNVSQVEENVINVYVELEKLLKNQPVLNDKKKKK